MTSTIADFEPEAASRGLSSDVTAGVVQRFGGHPPFTGLFVVDPGDALLWLEADDSAEDPLARFVEWGSLVLSGVAEQLPSMAALEPGAPALDERPLMAALLATHPPSDTLVLSIQGDLVFTVPGCEADLHAPFSIHVLLAPKFVSRISSDGSGDTDPANG